MTHSLARSYIFIALVLFISCLTLNCSNRSKLKSKMPLPWILAEAHRQYWDAEFNNSLKIVNFYLNECVKRRIIPSKVVFILLPQIYIKKGDYVRARRATLLLLRVDPMFIPNPDDYPIQFVLLLTQLKKQKKLANSDVSQN